MDASAVQADFLFLQQLARGGTKGLPHLFQYNLPLPPTHGPPTPPTCAWNSFWRASCSCRYALFFCREQQEGEQAQGRMRGSSPARAAIMRNPAARIPYRIGIGGSIQRRIHAVISRLQQRGTCTRWRRAGGLVRG